MKIIRLKIILATLFIISGSLLYMNYVKQNKLKYELASIEECKSIINKYYLAIEKKELEQASQFLNISENPKFIDEISFYKILMVELDYKITFIKVVDVWMKDRDTTIVQASVYINTKEKDYGYMIEEVILIFNGEKWIIKKITTYDPYAYLRVPIYEIYQPHVKKGHLDFPIISKIF